MFLVQKINKRFTVGKEEVHALKAVSIQIDRGDFLLIKGPNGSGKSTLLFTLGGMSAPSAGTVLFKDKPLYGRGAINLDAYRAKEVGFVFEKDYLLPYLTLKDNIAITLKNNGKKPSDALIRDFIADLGLSHRLNHKPGMLSAGEQRRVALARAMIHEPSVILADEPIRNLDKENSLIILDHLKKYQERGGTVVMVTHRDLADACANKISHITYGTLKEN